MSEPLTHHRRASSETFPHLSSMRRYADPVISIATQAGLGYGFAYLGLMPNPVAAALLAASIAVIKKVAESIFEFDIYPRLNTTEILPDYIKLFVSIGVGGLVAEGASRWVWGTSLATVPLIHLVALTVLVDQVHSVLYCLSSTVLGDSDATKPWDSRLLEEPPHPPQYA